MLSTQKFLIEDNFFPHTICGGIFMDYKKYVEVIVKFDIDGKMTPLSIVWEDGQKYEIDRITDCIRAATLKSGGQGMRYTCIFSGHQRYLFFDDIRWFVE